MFVIKIYQSNGYDLWGGGREQTHLSVDISNINEVHFNNSLFTHSPQTCDI